MNAENRTKRRRLAASVLALVFLAAAAPDKQKVEVDTKTPAKADPCGVGRYFTNDALCAEWKSADAAAQAADWAWWQMLIAGGGLGVGTLTLIAAGGAAWFAREAARHTKAGADEARHGADIAANATRAWVVCEKIVLDAQMEFCTVPGLGDRYQMNGKVVIRTTARRWRRAR